MGRVSIVSLAWLSVVLFVLVDERARERSREGGSNADRRGLWRRLFHGSSFCVWLCMCLSAFRVRVCLVVVCGACVCDVCVVVVCVWLFVCSSSGVVDV